MAPPACSSKVASLAQILAMLPCYMICGRLVVEGLGRSSKKDENFSCLFLLKIGTAISAGGQEDKGRALTRKVYRAVCSLNAYFPVGLQPSNHKEV